MQEVMQYARSVVWSKAPSTSVLFDYLALGAMSLVGSATGVFRAHGSLDEADEGHGLCRPDLLLHSWSLAVVHIAKLSHVRLLKQPSRTWSRGQNSEFCLDCLGRCTCQLLAALPLQGCCPGTSDAHAKLALAPAMHSWMEHTLPCVLSLGSGTGRG